MHTNPYESSVCESQHGDLSRFGTIDVIAISVIAAGAVWVAWLLSTPFSWLYH